MRLHQWNSSFLGVHNVAGELVSEMHNQIKCFVVSKVTCLSRRLSLTSLLPQNELASGSICVCIIVLMLFVYLNCTLRNLTIFVQVGETYYM